MLLTITYKGKNAEDLGYLLHKNPARPQTIELNYGKAHIFYPIVLPELVTAAILLDLNPIDLVRGGRSRGLFDYVNDRPYVSSSFLSTAISKAFGTAMSGRCDKRPELAKTPLDLTAVISVLKSNGGEKIIRNLFEPLGYKVETEGYPLDTEFENWGMSCYYTVTIGGQVLLSELLTHLYVLIPVLDNDKHYWIGDDEVDKLVKHGGSWLAGHPMKDMIAFRYLRRQKSLISSAMEQLSADDNIEKETVLEKESALKTDRKWKSLNETRLKAVAAELLASGAQSVLDAGCGEGHLLRYLVKEPQFTKIAGMDVAFSAVEYAKDRLHYERMSDREKSRLTLFQGSLIYSDKRLSGYDACAVVEVIEHIDEDRLPYFELVLFSVAAPGTVVITTPNAEYNEKYENMKVGALRHPDHRFEWTRKQFMEWSGKVAAEYGYTVEIKNIGDFDAAVGSPTQMGVFKK